MFKKPLIYIFIALLFFGCSLGYYLGNHSAVSKIEYVEKPVVVVASPTPAETVDENELLSLVSDYRVKNGLGRLVEDPKLCEFATRRSIELVTKDQWSHEGFESMQKQYYSYYRQLGENLGMDYSTESGLLDAWIQSPTHKALMDNSAYNKGCVSVNSNKTVLIVGQSR